MDLSPRRVLARVLDINSESPSVKSVLLEAGFPYPFFAGQWVTVWTPAPRLPSSAGSDSSTSTTLVPLSDRFHRRDATDPSSEKLRVSFTLTGNPTQAQQDGKISIAVKRTGHPATVYIHDILQIGDVLEIGAESEGTVYFTSDMSKTVILVAGGIGIASVLAMCRYMVAARCVQEAHLFYSVRDPIELAFHDDLVKLAEKSRGLMKLHFSATGETRDQKTLQGLADVSTTFLRTTEFSSFVKWKWPYFRGRWTVQSIQEIVKNSTMWTSMYFLAGPPGMIEDLSAQLRALNINPSRIRYEHWSSE
eukprot:ANDGO_04924.mRNA.1 Oxidoreductase NAD-binding domain-containing protein 1 OS=Danio rerio GN=oxnad1 PE=2 SV=1